ncbi:MAG: DUF4136 domain-containing protein [Burkholderiaceae bacterium]
MKAISLRPVARLLAVLTVLYVLVGCATGPQLLRTQVTTFNEWSALPAEKTYVFARTLEFQNSLELKSYEDIVRDELTLQGFKLATDPGRAQLVVTLRPSISSTQVRVRDPWPDPFWRPYGGWYGRRGFGWYDPYWSFPDSFSDYTIDVFRRRLELDIDSKTVASKRYYEGRVESTGETDGLPAVMPYLIRALFTDFPGNNGQTRRVDVPVAAAVARK